MKKRAKVVFPTGRSTPVKKQRSIKSLEKAIQRILYPIIKRRDAKYGCASCNKNPVGSDSHAGHYGKAELCNILLRYYPPNINKQCSQCNLWSRGNTLAYRVKTMLPRWGVEVTEFIDTMHSRPTPINFNERDWLVTTLSNIRRKPDEFVLEYLTKEVETIMVASLGER